MDLSRNILIAGAVVLLSAFPALAQQNPDEEELRSIVGKYFDAQVRKDLDAFAALWSERAPEAAGRRQALERMFATYTYRFTDPVISRLKIDGVNSSLRVSTTRTTHDAIKNLDAVSQMSLDLSFLKEGESWKLWNERPAVVALFESLASATDDGEREKLMDEDPQSVTRELLTLLSGRSDYAYAQGNYDRAHSLLKSLLIAAERLKEPVELAGAWHNIAIIHFLRLRYSDALSANQNALAIYQQLGSKPETARALANLGLVYNAQRQSKEALEYFQRAQEIYQEVNARADLAQTFDNIGNVRYELGDYALASEFYQKSVKIYEAIGARSSVVSRLLQIARLEYERGDDAGAIDYYQQALVRMDPRGGEENRGFALHNIANIYYSQGDYQRALDYYRRRVKLEEESGNKQGAAGALLGVGLVYALESDHQRSLEAYEKYLSYAEASGNETDWALGLQKVGAAHFNLKNYQQALEDFQKALTMRQRLGDAQETAGALLDVGIGYGSLGDYPNALEYYRKSRDLYQSVNNYSGVAGALLNTSVVHFAQTDYAKSLEVAEQAARAAKQASDQDLYWQARHRAGRAYYRLGQLDQAVQALTEAISVIETKLTPGNRNNQPRFFESKLAPYLAMVDVSIAQGAGAEAFNFSERVKARVLLGVLQSGRVWINKTMTPAEAERERQLMAEQYILSAQIYRERDREKPHQERLADLSAKLKKSSSDYEQFKNALYLKHPQLKVMRGEGKPFTSEQASSLLTDTQTALISAVETDERVYLFIYTRNRARATPSLKIYPLFATRSDLAARIDAFNQKIAGRDVEFQSPARELFELLFKDAQEQLAGKTRLIIAPDGALWRLPFQALQPSENSFLIEERSIGYTPSLTALASIRRLNARPPSRTAVPNSALLVGEPAISQQNIEWMRQVLADPRRGSSGEIEALRLVNSPQVQIWTGGDANKSRFKAESGKYALAHLAVPAALNEAAPLFSSVFFSSADGSQAGGLFETRELLGLDLRTELVIFSQSEAVLPETVTGRALTGLAWALFIAGCPSALVNQRRAEPEVSTQLMAEFHRELLATHSKPVAWQAAVKKIISHENYRHPYYWSGFTLLSGGN